MLLEQAFLLRHIHGQRVQHRQHGDLQRDRLGSRRAGCECQAEQGDQINQSRQESIRVHLFLLLASDMIICKAAIWGRRFG
jgi:hypothetical protein